MVVVVPTPVLALVMLELALALALVMLALSHGGSEYHLLYSLLGIESATSGVAPVAMQLG